MSASPFLSGSRAPGLPANARGRFHGRCTTDLYTQLMMADWSIKDHISDTRLSLNYLLLYQTVMCQASSKHRYRSDCSIPLSNWVNDYWVGYVVSSHVRGSKRDQVSISSCRALYRYG